MATTAAVRPRHARAFAGLDWRDGDIWTAIGDALISRSNSWKYRKQHGFHGSPRSRSDCGAGETTLSCQADTQQNPRNKAEKRCHPHANGIEIFLLEQGEREFERDVDATMRTVLGRGFSDPSASLFI
jgi:hypothetical protein